MSTFQVLLGVPLLLLHAALVLAAPPFLATAMGQVRARLLGGAGPMPLQAWRDLVRLLRKQPVVTEGASALLPAVPAFVAGTTVAAALLIPSFALGMATAPLSDLVLLFGLLASARLAEALAAFDTGTAPGGMGATRTTLLAAFSATALVLMLFVLALLTGTTNLDTATAAMRDGELSLRVPLLLALVAACMAALADTRRKPVDDPADGFVAGGPTSGATGVLLRLEYSGRHLALLDYADGLRLLLWLSLIAAVFLPFGLAPAGAGPLPLLTGLLLWPVKVGVLALVLAVLEAALVRLRVGAVPRLLGCAILLGLLAAMLLLIGQDLA